MAQIKTIDLCRRCEFFYSRKCSNNECNECPMSVPKNGFYACKCHEIEFNTPCPYFEEAKDENE